MNATIVDLRYRMKEVLAALDQKESVQILYHGKPKAVILPLEKSPGKRIKVKEHAFFGMKITRETVARTMNRLRGGRYRDL